MGSLPSKLAKQSTKAGPRRTAETIQDAEGGDSLVHDETCFERGVVDRAHRVQVSAWAREGRFNPQESLEGSASKLGGSTPNVLGRRFMRYRPFINVARSISMSKNRQSMACASIQTFCCKFFFTNIM